MAVVKLIFLWQRISSDLLNCIANWQFPTFCGSWDEEADILITMFSKASFGKSCLSGISTLPFSSDEGEGGKIKFPTRPPFY